MAPRFSLAIVIVAYRSEELLRTCLGSLKANPPSRPHHIHVVDNGGDGAAARLVAREFPAITVTTNASNVGFGRATNQVIRSTDSEYVLALNPDTEVTDGALDQLLDLLDADASIGIVGPRLVRADGSLDPACRRSFPTPLSALGHFSGTGRRLGRGPLAAYSSASLARGPVDAVNGAFMLIRRLALDEVGAFDERYWMYMEDLDLCYRFAEADWVTWYEPSVTVGHVKHGTSGKRRGLRLDLAFHAGMYRFYADHYAARHSRAVNAFIYTAIAIKLCASRIVGMTRSIAARAGRSVSVDKRPA